MNREIVKEKFSEGFMQEEGGGQGHPARLLAIRYVLRKKSSLNSSLCPALWEASTSLLVQITPHTNALNSPM